MYASTFILCILGFMNLIAEPFCYGVITFIFTYRISRTALSKAISMIVGFIWFCISEHWFLYLAMRIARVGLSSADPQVSELLAGTNPIGTATFHSGEQEVLSGLSEVMSPLEFFLALLFVFFGFYISMIITRRKWNDNLEKPIGSRTCEPEIRTMPDIETFKQSLYIKNTYYQDVPINIEEANNLLQNGKLDGDELARFDGTYSWVPLREIKGVIVPSPPEIQ